MTQAQRFDHAHDTRKNDTASRITPYQAGRYHVLHELRRVRAMGRIGTASVLNCTKERRQLQRDLVKLRASRG